MTSNPTTPPDVRAIAEELDEKLQAYVINDIDLPYLNSDQSLPAITQALTQVYQQGASDMRERAAKEADGQIANGEVSDGLDGESIRALPLSADEVKG